MHVVNGLPGLKIHAKSTLVVRREADGLRRYVHIGTGNYHALTARLYEDLGLFTADEEIASEVADLFNYLTGFGRPQEFRRLLVSPFNLRSRMLEEIERVTKAATRREGRAHPDQGQRHPRRGDDRGALPRVERRREDRHRRPAHLRDQARREGDERENLRAERARAIPRAQPLLHFRRGRGEALLPRQRRPPAAEPRPPDRDRRPGRLPARCSRSSSRSSAPCSPTTSRPGSSAATAPGRAARRRRTSGAAPPSRFCSRAPAHARDGRR